MLIICLGMIRSGSTLQYNFSSEIIERSGTGKREGYFEAQEYQAFRRTLIRWSHHDHYHVIKTHEWIPVDEFPHNNVRFVLVYRDPIQVANSAKKKWNQSINRTISSIDRSIDILTRLQNDNRALIQEYTQLTTQKARSIVDIANHLNISIEEEFVSEICRANNSRTTKNTVQKTRSSLSRRAFRFARQRKITSKIGNFLRAARIPKWLYFRIRRMTSDFDNKSLYHENHVANMTGTVLTREEKTTVANRYGKLPWFIRE